MSDCKCSHNDHTHFFLYFAVFGLLISTCTEADCSGDQRRMQNQINQLQQEVNTLKANQR